MTARLALLAVPTAVYRLYDASGALLYVGISHAPDKRFARHAYERPWWPEVARKAITWCADRREAELAEVAAIAAEHPRYNVLAGIVEPVASPGVSLPAHEVKRAAKPEPGHEHPVTPHRHITAPAWCSGRYWCPDCRTWLTGPPCTGTRLAHPAPHR